MLRSLINDLSSNAIAMCDTQVGYRSENISDNDWRICEPLKILNFERDELNNDDYGENIDLENIKTNEDLDKYLKSVLGDYHLVWLCDSKENVDEAYFYMRDDEHTITKYHLPDTALLVCDLGVDGSLFAFDGKLN